MNRPKNLQPSKSSLLGFGFSELAQLLSSETRARALLKWLWSSNPFPQELPSAIANVNARSWNELRNRCNLALPKVIERRRSEDGTIKYALEAGDGATFESVLIPANRKERGRITLCVSSQSGCSRRCSFCATAKLGLRRNLDAGEIVAQYALARMDVAPEAPLKNIVFMGMGEPFDNYDSVVRAIEILTLAPGPAVPQNQITVSTCGVLPKIGQFLDDCPANLALSLHGTTDEQRDLLMPHNRIWSINTLMALLKERTLTSKRIFFIEYVMFDGFNDSCEDANRLLILLQGIRARVNLIPHNSYSVPQNNTDYTGPGEFGDIADSRASQLQPNNRPSAGSSDSNPLKPVEWRPSDPARIARFQRIIQDGGVRCMVRMSRGSNIDAACGQLALRYGDLRNSR